MTGEDFKNALASGEHKMGLFINSHSPTVAEQMSHSVRPRRAAAKAALYCALNSVRAVAQGFDWLLIDTQHGPMDRQNLGVMLNAVHSGAPPLRPARLTGLRLPLRCALRAALALLLALRFRGAPPSLRYCRSRGSPAAMALRRRREGVRARGHQRPRRHPTGSGPGRGRHPRAVHQHRAGGARGRLCRPLPDRCAAAHPTTDPAAPAYGWH